MTREEFARIALAIRSYYPREKNLLSTEETITAWYEQLKDIPYQTMSVSLSKWVSISKWSPTVAELREMSFGVTHGDIKDWSEGWEQVLDAIRYYGWNREIEALDSMDEITRLTVRRLGWINLCMSEEISVERANFRNIYTAIAERQQKEGQIPPSIRMVIQATQEANKRVLEVKPKKDTETAEKPPHGDFEPLSDAVRKKIDELKEKLSK